MKSTARLSFIIAVLLYAILLLAGYWLFSLAIKEPKQQPEKLTALPVSLNMFQATAPVPTIQAIVTPPAVEVKVIEKPAIKPIVKPTADPKVVPKREPIIAKPVIKKPALPVEPIVAKPTIVKPKAVKPKPPKLIEKPVEEPKSKAVPTLTAKPSPAKTQNKAEAEPVAPQLNRQVNRQQQANAEQAYLYELRSEILMHAQNTYPRRAKRRRWEGIVTLSFTLLPSGKILGLRIQESSGRQILDDAATSIFQSKMRNQFQPFPAEINRKEWKITIPVSYHLR
jgi:protein TonB